MAIACFTFDNMGEAAEVGAGRRAGPMPDGEEPSLAVGYPALLALLARRGVRATFFVEGWNGIHHPAAVRAIVAHGHELGMHGWTHEAWSELDSDREATLARRATDALEHAAGVRPRGFRAPGGRRTAHTEAILQRLGYAYDASLGDGMTPSRLPGGLAQIPFVWPGVDGFHYLGDAPAAPAAVRDAWIGALRKAAARDGLFLTVCHAFITGTDPERVRALEAVIDAAQAAGLTIATAGEVAARLPD
ncbi:polysaccharide deacetylase family protein [bacterium]|nr:polysaccharide deacetylase family protein [bacterium]